MLELADSSGPWGSYLSAVADKTIHQIGMIWLLPNMAKNEILKFLVCMPLLINPLNI